MSRVGKQPIPVPAGVTLSLKDRLISVQGPKGALQRPMVAGVDIRIEEGVATVTAVSDETTMRARRGLMRALVNNMVIGVTTGYIKELELVGVGYKAEPRPYGLELSLGYSHVIEYRAPAGIKCSVDNNVNIKVEGIDKELVGRVAAEIRQLRPPEPYKGKGVRYAGEHVRRKAGKTAAK